MNLRVGTSLSRRYVASMFAAMILAIAALLALSSANATKGDSGDKLREFDPVEMTCFYGSSVAFDGTKLYSSCWGSNVLYRISPVNGSAIGSGQAIAGLAEIGAMSWDSFRGKLWVCSNAKIYTINATTFVAQLMFDTIPQVNQESCRDGLAYDRRDDTLWLSGDGDMLIYHFTTAGVLIQTYTPGPPIAGGHSGLAVSGSRIYVAHPNTGVIYSCNKTFTSCSVTVASAAPAGHPTIEDLECDNQTFDGKHAIWNESQQNPYLTAWEVPASSCVTGGGPAPAGGLVTLMASDSASPIPWAPLAAAVAGAALAVLAAGGWYGRRRWLR